MAEVIVEGRRLDIKEGLDFSFNYSIADVRDPNKRSTEYSKTIICPGTPSNDELFGNIWDVNISNPNDPVLTNIETNFNPNKKAEARVTADGVEVMTGVVQLRTINILNGKIDYEVVFIGKLKNIFSVLGDKALNEVDEDGNVFIDFSDLDHFLTEPIVTGSWLNTTGYVYPMIDYGLSFDYDSDGRRIYDIEDWRPAVYLKTIVDKIFDYSGFTYDSTFFDSAPFTKLVVPWFKESFSLTDSQIADRQFTAQSTSDSTDILLTTDTEMFGNTSYTLDRLEFDDLSDPNNLWNDTTYEFEVANIGYYKMYLDAEFTMNKTDVSVVGGVLPCQIIIKKLSNSVETIIDSVNTEIDIPEVFATPVTTTIEWSSDQELLFVGDTVWYEIWFTTQNFQQILLENAFTLVMDSGSNAFNQVAEQQVFEQSDVYMNNYVPDIGMSDLLLSVFKMFNLYVTVDPENETNLLIETRDDYYAGGTTKDWTKKLARDRKATVKPLGSLTAKEYIYTYSEDEDYYNARFQNSKGYTYGRRRIDMDNDFLTNTRKVEIDFAPTPLVNDGVTNRIIPKIYDEDIDEGVKPVDFMARVLYYGGRITSNPAWTLRYSGGNTEDIHLVYPYAGHLDDPISPSLDLNFGIPNQLYYSGNGYTGTLQYTNANLFNVYHRAYLDEITDKDSKVLKAEFYLTAWDISKLDFRDQIIVDNAYWRLNKVNDYNPFKEGLTKVELIKILDIVEQPNEVFTLGTQGSSNGEQYPTNKHESKVNRNQFQQFKGSVKGRRNKVNDSATSFNILGDDNFIGAGSKNVSILGNNNEVIDGASNVSIINSDNQKVSEDNIMIVDGNKMSNCRVQCASLTIPTAEVLTLNSVPVEIVAAPGAGYAVQVINAAFNIDFNSVAYATNTTLEVVTNTATTAQVKCEITSTSNQFGTLSSAVIGNPTETQIIENAALNVSVQTGDPTAGNSDIEIKVLYRIISV